MRKVSFFTSLKKESCVFTTIYSATSRYLLLKSPSNLDHRTSVWKTMGICTAAPWWKRGLWRLKNCLIFRRIKMRWKTWFRGISSHQIQNHSGVGESEKVQPFVDLVPQPWNSRQGFWEIRCMRWVSFVSHSSKPVGRFAERTKPKKPRKIVEEIRANAKNEESLLINGQDANTLSWRHIGMLHSGNGTSGAHGHMVIQHLTSVKNRWLKLY